MELLLFACMWWFVVQDSESRVFYFKMKGDYYRYISEFSNEEGKKASAEQAEESYKRATETAEAELPSTHPIRLGLALNYSVFYYEILNQPQKACEMAKLAFDDAITEFDSVRTRAFVLRCFACMHAWIACSCCCAPEGLVELYIQPQ